MRKIIKSINKIRAGLIGLGIDGAETLSNREILEWVNSTRDAIATSRASNISLERALTVLVERICNERA